MYGNNNVEARRGQMEIHSLLKFFHLLPYVIWHISQKKQKSANFFYKGQLKILGFVDPTVSLLTYSALPLWYKSSHWQYINDPAWLYSNITFFVQSEMWISRNFHLRQTIILLFWFFSTIENVKTILSSHAE